MSIEDSYLTQFKVGKKEEFAAKMAFFLPGFTLSTWAPMIPMVKERLGLEADVLGLLLLCIGVSAFLVMPIAGFFSRRFGCKRVMTISALILSIDIVVLSCLPNIYSYAICLIILGASMGTLEVNMNINAVVVEKIAKKRMMSGMHAFWSIGCFLSAGLFSLLSKLGLDVFVVALIHCIILLVVIGFCASSFLAYKGAGNEKAIALPKGIVILFGVFACATFLGEGAIMDWSGVFLTEVKQVELSLAGVGYAIFSVAMFLIRLVGDKIVQRFGERKVIFVSSMVTGVGFLLVIAIDNLYYMSIGFILLGLGAANIVPVLYSLLKHQKDMQIGSAVTAVTCMGYTGVIMGPAILGFIAHMTNITSVFYLLAVIFIVQAFCANYLFRKLV